MSHIPSSTAVADQDPAAIPPARPCPILYAAAFSDNRRGRSGRPFGQGPEILFALVSCPRSSHAQAGGPQGSWQGAPTTRIDGEILGRWPTPPGPRGPRIVRANFW